MKCLHDIPSYNAQVEDILKLPLAWEHMRGKTVLISGATGMIGSLLTDVLIQHGGIKVLALSRDENKAKERFGRYFSFDRFRFVSQEISGTIAIDEPVHFIIHAASNTHPLQYSGDPIGTIMTNIAGTGHMLDLAVRQSECRFLFLSSVEIYGENRGDTDKFDESYCGYIDCNTLRAGYPEGKRAGEALCQAYMASCGVDAVIGRLCRVYGPTMQKDDSKAIAQFIRKCSDNNDVILKSSGSQLFSYVYSADAVTGLLYVLLKGESGGAYNIAANGSHDITLKDLALMLAEIAGTNVVFAQPDEGEKLGYSKASKALLDTRKLRALGWTPSFDIEDGLRATIEILKGLK